MTMIMDRFPLSCLLSASIAVLMFVGYAVSATTNKTRGQISCIESNLTFDLDEYCDGEINCPFGDDELFCTDGCRKDYVKCLNRSEKCISHRSICDGHVDCHDGSDEMLCDEWHGCPSFCECTPFSASCKFDGEGEVHGLIFSQALRILSLQGNSRLSSKTNITFSPSLYPLLIKITIQSTGVTSLDSEDWSGLTILQDLGLSRNLISNIDCSSFINSSHLTKLALSINAISNLDCLPVLPHLTELVVAFNKIRGFDRGIFRESTKLEKILINNNEIESLSEWSFDGLLAVEWIVMSMNQISYIAANYFRNLTTLEMLNLSDNRIKIVEFGAFFDLISLRQLFLKGNHLVHVDAFSTLSIPRLTRLDLSHNKILDVEPSTFTQLPVLDSLYLQGNPLTRLKNGSLAHLQRLVSLTLSSSNISAIEPGAFQESNQLVTIDLRRNVLTEIKEGVFAGLYNLEALRLQENSIVHIDPFALQGLQSLRQLELYDNAMTTMEQGIFDDLVALEELNLSFNPINFIEKGTFDNVTRLRELHLVETELKQLRYGAFNGLQSLKSLSTDDYRLCCLFEDNNITCSVINKTPFDSCSHLTHNNILRVSMWIIGFGALFGNFMVIFFRFREEGRSSQSVQRLFITNLAFADLLMGVYMITIASADIFYGEHYFLSAPIWRESPVCRLAGFVALLSSESTVFLLALITIDRFICITFPFGAARFRPTSAKVGVLLVWALTFTLSLAPTLIGVGDSEIYGQSDVCLGLPFDTYVEQTGRIVYDSKYDVYEFIADHEPKRRPNWVYSIFLFLGVNFIVLILIFFCYVIIFIQVHRSAKSAGTERMKQERRMTVKMALIVGTDFCCWLPVIIMGILSQTGVLQLPVSLYAWSVVFILPINSTLNPYLYSLVALCSRKKDQKFPLSHVSNVYDKRKISVPTPSNN